MAAAKTELALELALALTPFELAACTAFPTPLGVPQDCLTGADEVDVVIVVEAVVEHGALVVDCVVVVAVN